MISPQENVLTGDTPVVLFVDDDESLQYAVRRALTLQGRYRVETASDVEDALQRTDAMAFDLAILDIRLNGRNGAELGWTLHQRFPEMPIIALSGDLANWDRTDLEDLGFREVLEKPIGMRDLLDVVGRYLPDSTSAA